MRTILAVPLAFHQEDYHYSQGIYSTRDWNPQCTAGNFCTDLELQTPLPAYLPMPSPIQQKLASNVDRTVYLHHRFYNKRTAFLRKEERGGTTDLQAVSLCNQWLYERLCMNRVLRKSKISWLENDVIPSIPVEHTELASSLETFETMATPPRAPVGLPPSPLRVSGSDHGDSVTGLYCEVCTGLRTGKHRGKWWSVHREHLTTMPRKVTMQRLRLLCRLYTLPRFEAGSL